MILMRIRAIRQRLSLLTLVTALAVYVLVSVQFTSSPLFEGPDELEHYRYVEWIARTGSLPPPAGQMGGQYHQPPLYYLLLAPVLRVWGLPAPQFMDITPNPHYPYLISELSNDNKNLWLHPQAVEQGADGQAARVLRLFSTVCGAATVVCLWLTARRLFPDQWVRQALMVFIGAWTPQFVYITSVMNNDALLILLSSALTYLVVRYSALPTLRARHVLLLGAVFGAALLAKTNALFLGFVLVAWLVYKTRSPLRWVQFGLAALAVVGWWYARNIVQYDDLFLTAAHQVTWPGDVIQSPDAWQIALGRLSYSYATVWARFGSGAVAVSAWVGTLFDGLLAACLLGWGWALLRFSRSRLSSTWVFVALLGGVWVLVLYYLATIAWSGIQGRYLLPGLVAWAALLSAGLLRLIPVRWQSWGAALACALLFLGLQRSLVDFRYSFQVPAPDADAGTLYTYGDVAELSSVRPAVVYGQPEERVRLRLNWRALRTPESSLKVFVHSLTVQGEVADGAFSRDSYPATGNLLAQDWQAGSAWAEDYLVRLPPEAVPQRIYSLIAGLYEADSGASLPVSQSGAVVGLPVVGTLVITSPPRPAPDALLARFGESLLLSDVRLSSDAASVCLTWYALRDGSADLQRFVHFFDQQKQLIGQVDGSVHEGAYPARFWRQGELVRDCVPLPADAQSLATGWYDPVSLVRLAAVDSGSARLPNDQVIWSRSG